MSFFLYKFHKWHTTFFLDETAKHDDAKVMLDGELFWLKNFWRENPQKKKMIKLYIVFEISNVFNKLGFFKQKFPFPMEI